MRRLRPVLLGTALIALSGCGGGAGGGLSLSGGSIPTGGGTITGKLALPSGQPVTSATTTVTSLDTSQPITVTPAIDSAGNFTLNGVPLSTDLSITFVSGNITLKAIIPASEVTSSKTPVDVGNVDAFTTVTAVAIETEVSAGVDDPATVVSSQFLACQTNQAAAGETVAQQNSDITDPIARRMSANRLISITADSEMAGLSSANAGSALDGILSYAFASGGAIGALTPAQRHTLVTVQTVGAGYSATQIAAALTSAGVVTTSAAVITADSTQRQTIPSFSRFGNIPAFEAVALASCPTAAGGFGLTGTQLSTFVDALTASPAAIG